MSDHTHRQSRFNSGTESSRWTGLLILFFITNTHLQHRRKRKCGRPPDTPWLSPVHHTQGILGPLTSSGSSRSPSGQYARPFTARTDAVQFPVRSPFSSPPRKQERAGLLLRGAKTGEGLAGHAPETGALYVDIMFRLRSQIYFACRDGRRSSGCRLYPSRCGLSASFGHLHIILPPYLDGGLRVPTNSLHRVLASLHIPTGDSCSEGPA
jgi:hypothetical protein